MTEEHILDFLDGNLSSHQEEELLHRLAVSPERRDLLKQHLQMRELTSSLARRQYIPVPKTVTASLFTTLAANGYAGPKMPAPNSETLVASLEKNLDRAAQTVTKTPSLFRRSSMITASLISFIAGAALIYFLMPQARQEKLVASAAQSSLVQSPAIAALPSQPSVIPNDNSKGGSSFYKTYKSYRTYKTFTPAENNVNNTLPITIAASPSIGMISMTDAKSEQVKSFPLHVHGEGIPTQNPFDFHSRYSQSERSFLQRLSFSFSSGEGKAPGNAQALTGSIQEVKVSLDILDWLVAKVSLGRFAPFETEALAAAPGYNADGIPLLQLSPILKNRVIAGAEIGAKWQMFNAPFQFSGGVISDFQGNFIPRADFFTSLSLNDDIDMNVGLEAMLYNHNISPSLASAEAALAGRHAALVGQMQSKELTGFIGPAVELVWHW